MLEPFGLFDLKAFLDATGGRVNLDLTDAGMVRNVSAHYRYSTGSEAGRLYVEPILSSGRTAQGIEVPQVLELNPRTIAFLGLYDGDGNKTNDIGFAQNETHLQDFVFEGLSSIFGNVFPVQVTLLEDTRYFEAGEGRARLDQLRQEHARRGISLSERDLMEEVLRERYEQGAPGSTAETIGYVVSPLKGARSPGQSSFEIIKNHKGSRQFLPLFLSIMKEVIDSIQKDEPVTGSSTPGLSWTGTGQAGGRQSLDLRRYLTESERCCYVTPGDEWRQYLVVSADDVTSRVRKPRGNELEVWSTVELSPLLFMMFGHYLAEGATTKAKLFRFRDQRESGLSLEFNSSEEASMVIFLRGLGQIFSDVQRVVKYWKVKIGTKYFPETSALAAKLGVPVVRGGEKGQGKARTPEITDSARTWALNQFPVMNQYGDSFSHIEFTGSGIARMAVIGDSAAAPLLFALMVDLLFESSEIEPFITSC